MTVVVGAVLLVDIEALGLLLHPGPVLVDIRGVDNEEEILLAQLIDQQIVDGAAVGIAHHAIEYLAHRGTGHVVGEDVLHVALSLAAAHRDLAHVAHVEEAHMFAHGLMLHSDAGILDGHDEAAEGRHQRAHLHMLVVEACALFSLYRFLFDSHSKL